MRALFLAVEGRLLSVSPHVLSFGACTQQGRVTGCKFSGVSSYKDTSPSLRACRKLLKIPSLIVPTSFSCGFCSDDGFIFSACVNFLFFNMSIFVVVESQACTGQWKLR